MSLPLRITLRAILNVVLVWAMATYLPQYVAVGGGIAGLVIIGALFTLLNLIVRPILDLVTLPLKLLATLLAFLIVNGAFVWLTERAALLMDPSLVTFRIQGGFVGWVVVILAVGLANWLLKLLVR